MPDILTNLNNGTRAMDYFPYISTGFLSILNTPWYCGPRFDSQPQNCRSIPESGLDKIRGRPIPRKRKHQKKKTVQRVSLRLKLNFLKTICPQGLRALDKTATSYFRKYSMGSLTMKANDVFLLFLSSLYCQVRRICILSAEGIWSLEFNFNTRKIAPIFTTELTQETR